MFARLSFTLFCLLFSLGISAQITITEDRFQSFVGKSFREVLYETNPGIGNQLQNLINAAGADQSWDFSDLNYVDSTVILQRLEVITTDDPYLADERLAGSTHRWEMISPPVNGGSNDTSFQFNYGTFSDREYRVKGGVAIFDNDEDGQRDTFFTFYNTDFLEVRFPLEFGGEFHDSTGRMGVFQGMSLPTITELDSNFVDGWGTLITPAGSEEALRVTNKNLTSIPGIPGLEITRDIGFLSADGLEEGTINLEDEWAFYRKTRFVAGGSTSVRLPDLPDFRLLGIYPQPLVSRGDIHLQVDRKQRLRISIHDLNGRLLRVLREASFTVGEHHVAWPVDKLRPGSYLLRISAGNKAIQQIVIAGRP